ncbi:MAG: hypothetical protein V1875_09050 [Candidatus Altiarchaeota archaeon]
MDALDYPRTRKGLDAIILPRLLSYGFAHFAVDLACVASLFAMLRLNSIGAADSLFFVVLYNSIAFGTQVFFGYAVDELRAPRQAALAGLVLSASAVAVTAYSPLAVVLLAGVGNSLFHVGAGGISLNLSPGRASAPGVFVAPGAAGLALGVVFGMGIGFSQAPLILLLTGAAYLVLRAGNPGMDYERKAIAKPPLLGLSLALLLLVIMSRSFIGFAVSFPWKADIFLLAILTAAVVAGKSAGGMLADRFGWLRVSLIGLIASAPLLAFAPTIPAIAIIGAFFFQMTMAVTLVAVAAVFPGRPAFSFGLPCLAILSGALPYFAGMTQWANGGLNTLAVILVTALFLAAGLMGILRDLIKCDDNQ